MNTTDAGGAVDRSEDDLDLAVALVNTDPDLADRPERLTDVGVFQQILRAHGDDALAAQLTAADLPALRALRARLGPVFAAQTLAESVGLLDPLLRETAVPARLTAGRQTAHWSWGDDQRGMAALRIRLPAALAAHLVRYGHARLGVCHADPCRCVFVDRSRARTRRYCRDQCNDRAAAAAYRRRTAR